MIVLLEWRNLRLQLLKDGSKRSPLKRVVHYQRTRERSSCVAMPSHELVGSAISVFESCIHSSRDFRPVG